MMNIQLIVYRTVLKVQTTDKISKDEIEIIVWELISFLIDEYEKFLIDEMMNHCRNSLMFLKFLIKKFLELLIEMKTKMIVSEKFLLWTIHGISVSLMIAEEIFLINLEMMILEILIFLEIEVSIES